MSVETECVKRDTWISIGECDCNEFMRGWYHSTIRYRAMKEYEENYKAEMLKPIHPLEETANEL